MARYRVILEFNFKKDDDAKLYGYLSKFSNSGATVKDMLKGLVPLPNIFIENNN
ncbi:hypothetical protein [Clostridium baratii]|uniref:Uncharacterized protein n=1 Tax=Clostridium baratii TaxID=1561 RepID=A0A174QMU2_9CLOT|nr:hypothetical protein [Clostridium baratii]CUP71499.1 Uncharacterised protein [Clostridium baratii]